jgi:hypothetical protein
MTGPVRRPRRSRRVRRLGGVNRFYDFHESQLPAHLLFCSPWPLLTFFLPLILTLTSCILILLCRASHQCASAVMAAVAATATWGAPVWRLCRGERLGPPGREMAVM